MSSEQLRKRIRQAEQILARSRARFSELRKRRDPNRELADPGELRLMREAGQWNTERDQALHELARAEFGTPGITGSNGEYQWLSSMDHDLHDFARLCPSAMLGRYLAVTSIDSGSLRLSDADRAAGWWTGEGCEKYEYIPTRALCPDSHTAFSPRLESLDRLPNKTHINCCDAFHEWYIFNEPPLTREFSVFVNSGAFNIWQPTQYPLNEPFWRELRRVDADSYVSDGWWRFLTFVTRDAQLFDSVLAAFSADLEALENSAAPPESGPASES
jgi:hypothetical protein